jgi:hypothetical protein
MTARRLRQSLKRFGVGAAPLLLTVGMLGLAPGDVRATSYNGFTVLDSETWTEDGILWAVVRARNDTGTWIKAPFLAINVYDAVGHYLELRIGGAWLDPIAPGATGTFLSYSDNPAADHWAISNIGGTTPARRPVAAMSAEALIPYDDGVGRVWPVRISNPNDVQIVDVTVTLTIFDAQGHVLNVNVGSDNTFFVPPHGSADIPVRIDRHYANAASAIAQVVTSTQSTINPIYVTWDDYFGDVTAFRNDVVWLAVQGITGGCAQNMFCPNASVTRAQMAMFLVRAFDYPPATGPDHFVDDDGVTGESSINALFEAGITGGCSPGHFCPKASVTRAQMALFLDRALGLAPTATDYFDDDDGITGEAAINRMAAAGITGGCGPRRFCPKSSVTRGQMAAFLHRALTN